ncbi:MAG: hypothetical protein QOG74_3282 [Alphaproteobacteria bacterium]|jgi:hypothetical protein|nr:hypothetical protein [Alphaproteobacteria bacterium]
MNAGGIAFWVPVSDILHYATAGRRTRHFAPRTQNGTDGGS